MIKKLNKDRGEFKRKPWLYYFDEGTDDSSRISYDAHSIDMTLRDLHERLWLSLIHI